MKTKQIVLRPEGSLESILSLAPTVAALRSRFQDCEIGVAADDCFREAVSLVPGAVFLGPEIPESAEVFDFTLGSEESWGLENLDWRSYLQSCAPHSTNPYHEIDILRKAADAEQFDVNYELSTTNATASLPESVLGGEALRIALCASSLGLNELQAALEGISRLEVPTSVHLLGTVSDKRKASLLVSAWDGRLNVVDLCGRQSLSEAAETWRHCDIAVTAPGASALLSSGYGTFTLCVDNARNPLHYPYGHGHLVIQSAESEEFHQALAGLMGEIVYFALKGNEGNIPSLEQWQGFADERVDNYLGRLRLMATQRIELRQDDSLSFTELYVRPLIYLGAEYGDVLRTFYRLVWENSLRGREISTDDLSVLHQGTLAELRNDLHPLEQIYALANFGRTYSLYIHNDLAKEEPQKARQDAGSLQETEELLQALGNSFTALAPLTAFHEKRQRLLPEIDPLGLARQMEQQFAEMQSRVLVLLDLAKTLFHTTLQNEAPAASGKGQPNG